MRLIPTHLAFGAALTLAGACQWGTRPENFSAAQRPAGARVAVRVIGERADRLGELYAVDTTGVTLHESRLVRVPWPRLQAMDVNQLGAQYDVAQGETVGAEKRERLALVSRFPQGLNGELLTRVLGRLRQDALDTVP